MHDHELKELWRAQSLEPPPLPDSGQIANLKARALRLNRTLFWRDIRENSAAVFVILCFGAYFFLFPSPLARVGSVLVILSGLLLIIYPIWRKRRIPTAAPDAPLMEALERQLHKVEIEIALLRTVLWHSILPASLGAFVFILGIGLSPDWIIPVALLGVAFDALLYWLNQIACDKKLLPLKQEFESLLRGNNDEVPSPERPKNYTMAKVLMLISFVLFLGAANGILTKGDSAPSAEPPAGETAEMLEVIRAKHGFPALAAAVVVDGELAAIDAVGFRRHGGTEAVTPDDKFHIGSVTKSMTATLAAMLVEDRKIDWTTTIGDSFPELRDQMHPDYAGVTLEQLLAHRGGAPAAAPQSLWREAWKAEGTPEEQRMKFVQGILIQEPETAPGTRTVYSNQGYAIAGAMLERATGKAWEVLMRERLFDPLEMASAGFGAPATPGKVDQPWGHAKKLLSATAPVPPGPDADNPAAIGPAATVHCSLGDLAKYVRFHLAGARGEGTLLKAETFQKLHAPVGGDNYALGWIVLDREWAGGRTLMHNGSNTMFYVVVWMAPERNSAVVVATNVGVDTAFSGCDEAAAQLIQRFLLKE